LALQDLPGIRTSSEGAGEERQVVIFSERRKSEVDHFRSRPLPQNLKISTQVFEIRVNAYREGLHCAW